MSVAVTDLKHGIILEVLPDIYNDETFFDVIFYCKGGRPVRSHRLLLSTVSPFLQTLFYEQKSRDIIEISVPDFNAEDLDIFLRFLYEGVIRLDQEEITVFADIRKTLKVNVSIVVQSETSEKILEDPVTRRKRKLDDLIDDAAPCSKVPKIINPVLEERQHVVSCLNSIINNFKLNKQKEKINYESNNVETSAAQKPKTPLLVPIGQFQKVVNIYERKRIEKNLGEMVALRVKEEIQRIREEQKKRSKKSKQVNPAHVPPSVKLPPSSKSNTSTEILSPQSQVAGNFSNPSTHTLKPTGTSQKNSTKPLTSSLPAEKKTSSLPAEKKTSSPVSSLKNVNSFSPVAKSLLQTTSSGQNKSKLSLGVTHALRTPLRPLEKEAESGKVITSPNNSGMVITPPNNSFSSTKAGKGFNLFDSPLDCPPSPRNANVDVLQPNLNGILSPEKVGKRYACSKNDQSPTLEK